MHFEELSAAPAEWLPAPLKPMTTGEIRYLFVYFGLWSRTDEVGIGVEKQLERL